MNECADCSSSSGSQSLADCLHCSRRLCQACLTGHWRQLRREALDLHAAAVGRLAELAAGDSRQRERADAEAFFDEAAAALEERRRRVLDRLAGHGELDDLLEECGRALHDLDAQHGSDGDGEARDNDDDVDEDAAAHEREDMEELVGLVRLLAPLPARLAAEEGRPVCCLAESRSRLCDLLDAVDYTVAAADAGYLDVEVAGYDGVDVGGGVDIGDFGGFLVSSPSPSVSSQQQQQQHQQLGDLTVGVCGTSIDEFAAVADDASSEAAASAAVAAAGAAISPDQHQLEFWETDAVALESRLRPRKKKRRGRVEVDASCQTFKAEGRPVALAHLLGCYYTVETQPLKCVRVYNQQGSFLHQLQFKGEAATAVGKPRVDPYRLVACPVREWLLVVDNRHGCVLTVWPSGYVERRIGPAVSAKYSLNRPEDAATDGNLIFVCCPRIGVFTFSCADDSVRSTLPLTGEPGCPVRLAWCAGRPSLLVATLRCKSNRYEFLPLEVSNSGGGKNPALLTAAAAAAAAPVSIVSAAQPALVAVAGGRLVCARSAETDASVSSLVSLDVSAAASSTKGVAAAAVCLFKAGTGPLADLCRVSDTLVAACDPKRNVVLLLHLDKLAAAGSGAVTVGSSA